MMIYIIKSVFCLIVLLSFYKLFLENEKFHVFKRYYLLSSIIFSVVIPLVNLEIPLTSIDSLFFRGSELKFMENNLSSLEPEFYGSEYEEIFILFSLLYLTGILFFGMRYLRNLRNILSKVRQNERERYSFYFFIFLKDCPAPHSFLKYIFLNKEDFKNGKIDKQIIDHELAHVTQKHSWDILFVEFLQVFFWYNPLFSLLKKSIRLNHEFLADHAIIRKQDDSYNYTNLLLSFANDPKRPSLYSSFSQSEIKDRITMISRKFSKRTFVFKLFLLIPILGFCSYFFNQNLAAETKNFSFKTPSENSFYVDAYLFGKNQILIEDKNVTLDNVEETVQELIHKHQLSKNEMVVYRIFANENLELGIIMDVEERMFKAHNLNSKRKRLLLGTQDSFPHRKE